MVKWEGFELAIRLLARTQALYVDQLPRSEVRRSWIQMQIHLWFICSNNFKFSWFIKIWFLEGQVRFRFRCMAYHYHHYSFVLEGNLHSHSDSDSKSFTSCLLCFCWRCIRRAGDVRGSRGGAARVLLPGQQPHVRSSSGAGSDARESGLGGTQGRQCPIAERGGRQAGLRAGDHQPRAGAEASH